MSADISDGCGSRGVMAEQRDGAIETEYSAPQLAILFWCYKDADFCAERLRLLRAYSPGLAVYVLYSGRLIDSDVFSRKMAPYADDFYACRLGAHPAWRWLNGDLLIADWHRERGCELTWDTLVVVQWDMLVLGNLAEVFRTLKRDQILLSGTRPVAEVDDRKH